MITKAYLIGIHRERDVARLIEAATGVVPAVVASDAQDGGGLVVGHGDEGVTWIDVKPDATADAHLYPGSRTMVSMPATRGAARFLTRLASMTGGLVTPDTTGAHWEAILPPLDADLDAMGEAFTRITGWMDPREAGEVLNRISAGDCEPGAIHRLFPHDRQADERGAASDAYDAYRMATAPSPSP